LVDAGLGRWAEGTAPEGGGRRPRWFELFTSAPDISDIRSDGDPPPDDWPPDIRTDTRPEPSGGGPDSFNPTHSPHEGCSDITATDESRMSEMSGADAANTFGEGADDAKRVSEASVGRPLPSEGRVGPCYCLDTETTGLSPRRDRVRLL